MTGLTDGQTRYLYAIFSLSDGRGSVRSVDVASALGTSRASVHKMLRGLAQRGYISKERYGDVHLTAAGTRCCEEFKEKLDLLIPFFSGTLELSAEDAAQSAFTCLCSLPGSCVDSLIKKWPRLALQQTG